MNQKVKVTPAPMVHGTASISVSSSPRPHAGVISRGLRRVEPVVKITVNFRRLSLPKNSCIGLAFQSVLILLLNCFVLLYLIIHCYMVIQTFLIVCYALLLLN